MTVFVVLGLPRSGTSMAAGILHNLGVYMGKDFVKHGDINPKGSFEGAITKEIAASTRTKSMQDLLLLIASGGSAVVKRENVLRNILTSYYSNHSLWGFKETRVVLPGLFPGIVDILLEMDNDIRLVVTTRPQDEVLRSILRVFSLEKMSGEMIFKALASFAGYIHMAVSSLEVPTLYLGYNCVVDSPVQSVELISEFVGVSPTQAAIDFIDPSLRRSRLVKGVQYAN